MTFVVKAILYFPDGINKGQINVKASSPDEAEAVARRQLTDTWKSGGLQDIDIIEVRKR